MTFYLDSDQNPYNGVGLQAGPTITLGTTGSEIASTASQAVSTTGVSAGDYRLLAAISDSAHTRFTYAAASVSIAKTRPWRNSANRLDSTDDGAVTPRDALVIINEINDPMIIDPGSGRLPELRGPLAEFFYDTNGDGFATGIDVLQVVNHLNEITAAGEATEVDIPEPDASLLDRQELNAPAIVFNPQSQPPNRGFSLFAGGVVVNNVNRTVWQFGTNSVNVNRVVDREASILGGHRPRSTVIIAPHDLQSTGASPTKNADDGSILERQQAWCDHLDAELTW